MPHRMAERRIELAPAHLYFARESTIDEHSRALHLVHCVALHVQPERINRANITRGVIRGKLLLEFFGNLSRLVLKSSWWDPIFVRLLGDRRMPPLTVQTPASAAQSGVCLLFEIVIRLSVCLAVTGAL